MNNKILIQIEGRQFELGLEPFDALAQQEIIELFKDKDISVFSLLEISLEKIQEYHHQNKKIKDLLDKISL